MVKKLFRHECIAYSRSVLPFLIGLLGIAVLTRIVQFFESPAKTYQIFNMSSIVMLVIASLVCILLTLIIGVTRFYRNLFTGEGYLSFALPVTSGQHLFVKLITAVLFSALSVVAVLLAAAIATDTDMLRELWLAFVYLLKLFAEQAGTVHLILYAAEALLILIAMSVFAYLVFYTCIAIGQTARKNRILMAVVTYFVYYIICQILGTLLVVLFTTVPAVTDLLQDFLSFAEAHPVDAVHIILLTILAIFAVLSSVFALVTRYILCRKLNLE